jgi:polar amino acid transport system substrate-binding protein
MKRPLHWIIFALAGPLLVASASARPRLHVTTESSPPSAMMGEGRIIGFATDKIRAIMERAGVDYDIEILPWKRAYLLARTQANTCVYSTTRVPDRESTFKWIGPTHENDWTLFGRADRDYGISTLEDARKYRIGAYNGDVRSDALIAQGFIVDTVRDKLSNPRKLLVNRIDLWASSVRVGSALVAENGWSGQIVPVLTFKRTDLYLACHRSVPDALVRKMNAALRAMNSEGVSAAIERKYHYVGAPVRH